MSQPEIYHTWPDGRFSYDCRGCGACCKGLGIGLDAKRNEHKRLLKAYPEATPFLRHRGKATTIFNPRGGCWFLNQDLMCRVELEHGREYKPASCRLFPFNRVFRLDETMVVDYNGIVCPIRTDAPSGPLEPGQSGPVTHQAIEEEMRTIHDEAVVGVPVALDGSVSSNVFLDGERTVAASCFAPDASHASHNGILFAQFAVAPSQNDASQTSEHIGQQVEMLVDAISTRSPRFPDEMTVANAILATPSLRFNEVFGRRIHHTQRDVLRALPSMWLVWLHLLAEAESVSQRVLSLQEVSSIWSEVAGLGYIAARWHEPIFLSDASISLPLGPLRARLEAFMRDAHHNESTSVGTMIERVWGTTAQDRVVFLRALEPFLSRCSFERPTSENARKGRANTKRKRKRIR